MHLAHHKTKLMKKTKQERKEMRSSTWKLLCRLEGVNISGTSTKASDSHSEQQI